MRETLNEEKSVLLVNGITISNIMYADDTISLAENACDLQRITQKYTMSVIRSNESQQDKVPRVYQKPQIITHNDREQPLHRTSVSV